MLDPIIEFFALVFEKIGKGIGYCIGILLWPFIAFKNWLNGRGWFVKIPVFVVLVLIVLSFIYLTAVTGFWSIGDKQQFAKFGSGEITKGGGEQLADGKCQPSAIVNVAAELIDQNVNQGTWISSSPFYKAGLLFLIDWKETPFFDNRAAFQLGVNQAVRRTTVELVDRLGRVRGTSSISENLQSARQAANYPEDAWTLTFSPPFVQPSTPNKLREAKKQLLEFNKKLAVCDANYDSRADNLLVFLDRVSADIGSTSDILQKRSAEGNFTGFDRRADDRYWFAYGQLYGYYAILTAMHADFQGVFQQRNLGNLWHRVDDEFKDALSVQPSIVVNGSKSSIIKSHLESIGFDLLRVRSTLVEMRDVLDR